MIVSAKTSHGDERLRAIDTKTKQPRRVPLTADLLATFRQLYKVRYLGHDQVFLHGGKSMAEIRTALENANGRAASRTSGFTI